MQSPFCYKPVSLRSTKQPHGGIFALYFRRSPCGCHAIATHNVLIKRVKTGSTYGAKETFIHCYKQVTPMESSHPI
jgi:hypothetical protein